jgi:hypothetical protein
MQRDTGPRTPLHANEGRPQARYDNKESKMQSNRVRLTLITLFGVLALSALTATAAQAVEAPRWSISGTDLAEGKTHYISTKDYNPLYSRLGP